ncbi:MAG: RNA polymerase sigma factor [Leptospira sp.]|nr:RNA polymerase sigma factor [Leptospira sp.]
MRNEEEIQSLIQNLTNGDRRAWAEFYKDFHGYFHGFLLKRASNLDIDNILTDFYIQLVEGNYKRLRKFTYGGERAFVAWLFKILNNQIMNESKKIPKNRKEPIQLDGLVNQDAILPSVEPEPLPEEEEILHGITLDVFYDSIVKLKNVKEREAIYYISQGYTNEEISQRMKASINTVLSWTSRAKKKLKIILEKSKGVQ